jgi:hypothetical protein
MSTILRDPETCSWCLDEVEDSTLTDQPDGQRICRACVRELRAGLAQRELRGGGR